MKLTEMLDVATTGVKKNKASFFDAASPATAGKVKPADGFLVLHATTGTNFYYTFAMIHVLRN
jgi:uncharacterized ParB-like nuclease family protein